MYLCAMGMQRAMPKDLPPGFRPGGACFHLLGAHFLVLKIYWEGIGVSREIARAGYLENLFHCTHQPVFIRGKRGGWYKVDLLLTSGLRRTNLEPKGKLPKALDWICLSSFENGGI